METWEYKISMGPKLPMRAFKRGKWKVEVTDLRYLNETAVGIFEDSVKLAATNPNVEAARCKLDGSISKETAIAIADICTSVKVTAKKRGESYIGNILISGYSLSKDEDEDWELVLAFTKRDARAIYDYANSKNAVIDFDENAVATFDDLVVALIENKSEDMEGLA